MAQCQPTGGAMFDVRPRQGRPGDVLISDNGIVAVGGSRECELDPDAAGPNPGGIAIPPRLSTNHIHLNWSGIGWRGRLTGILQDQLLQGSDGIKAVANLHNPLKLELTSLRDLGMNSSVTLVPKPLDSYETVTPRLKVMQLRTISSADVRRVAHQLETIESGELVRVVVIVGDPRAVASGEHLVEAS